MKTKAKRNYKLRALCLEDDPRDAEIMRELLTNAGFDLKMDCTEAEKEFVSFLHSSTYDIILSDFKLPGFDGFTALRHAMELCPQVPFICVSGTIGEETAVELLKQGAVDYVLKDNLKRLPFAINRALDEAKEKELRRQAEEELKFKNIILSTQQEVSIDGILVIDENGKILSYNHQFVRMWGVRPEVIETRSDELVMNSVMDTLKEPQQFAEKVKYLYAHQNETSREEIALKDGRILDRYSAPMLGTDAKYYGRVWYFRDITERKRAEKILRESESRAKAMYQAIPDMIFRLDHQGIFLDYKADIKDLYAQSIPTIIGKRNRDITPPQFADLIDSMIHTTLMSKTPQTFEYHLPVHGGVVKNYEARMVTSGVDEVTAIVRDITERKKANEELKKSKMLLESVINSSKDLILVVDRDLRIQMSNWKSPLYDGCTEFPIGSHCFDAFIHRDAPCEPCHVFDVFNTGKPICTEYYNQYTKLFKEVNAYPIVDDNNNVTMVVEDVRDITERKRSEEELKKSEEKYRSIFENVQDVYYESAIDGTILEISPSIETVSKGQYLRNDLIGKSMNDFYSHDEERQVVLSTIRERGQVTDFEVTMKNRDGSQVPCSISAKIHFDAQGHPEKIIGSMHDITERKRAEEALRESEERFRSLYENSTVGLYRTTPDGKIILANPTLIKMLGYSSFEELASRNLEQEGFEPSFKRKNFIEQIEINGEVIGLEVAWARKDGSIVYVRESARVIRDPHGKTLYYDGSVEDVTQRKLAELTGKQTEKILANEQFLMKTLLDNVPDQIYFKDMESRFIRINKSLAERFGLSDPGQAAGKTDFDFFTEEHARQAFEDEQKIIHTQQPTVAFEEKETWPDGHETWILTNKLPLRDKTEKIIGTFGISRDITQQKKLQSQLLQTQKVQSIGTLAGGIAHDFNNILGIILAFVSILERSEGDKEKISKSVNAITQAVGRGAALVRQILTFARQTGVTVKPLLIPTLIREIVTMLKETFPELIEFSVTIENNIPSINADQSQLHQVLLNLCVNARDAMPKGGIIGIEVKTVASQTLIQQFPEARGDRYVSIGVSDTGIGMDEATKSRIFDPFFTTKEQGKGTGLGLSVVYGVIQDHHGFISVESKVGQGTTFHLYIPVPQEEKKTQEMKNIKVGELQRGSETILLVEDEELLREVVQSALESNGYKVLLATNGREAVEIYKKQYKDIAVVLSDMGLPKLGGIDVYTILKEINPNIKIIFASGFISLESRSELLKEGVKGFIQKPYTMSEMLQMVREVLNENGEK